jgi:hypothetical protein
MSSKPRTGINHKEYGVTSEGVFVFLDEALKQAGKDPRAGQRVTIKLTGGPVRSFVLHCSGKRSADSSGDSSARTVLQRLSCKDALLHAAMLAVRTDFVFSALVLPIT